MSDARSIIADLLADCDAHGIRLGIADDNGLAIDAPKDALTPDLIARMKAHKADLLAVLRPAPDPAPVNQTDAAAVWQAALDRLESDPLFPPDVMEDLRAADAVWADYPEAGELEDEGIEVIDPPDPCAECGTLELWQTLAGNWRCLRCDPPTKARRFAGTDIRPQRQLKQLTASQLPIQW